MKIAQVLTARVGGIGRHVASVAPRATSRCSNRAAVSDRPLPRTALCQVTTSGVRVTAATARANPPAL